jgi:hypothetical protein
VNAERPSAVGASMPEPHPEALIRDALSRLMIPDYEASAALDVLVGRLEFVETEWKDTIKRLVSMEKQQDKLDTALEQKDEAFRAAEDLISALEAQPTGLWSKQRHRWKRAREALGVPPPGGSSS